VVHPVQRDCGAQAIPSELREVATLFRFRDVQRWTTVILPGIFRF